ncbi:MULTISPECIES: COG4223 family protein [unclassified Bradyrhizobium]|uniref:COG4223 family protein n=1 Tax=unclassified Bradyrhizobium TaxID=2631580 RepID=UPI003834B191
MADDKPEDAGLAPDPGRAKRTPPTIDLEATEVSTQPQQVAGEPEASEHVAQEPARVEEPGSEQVKAEPQSESAEQQASAAAPVSAPISPWIIAPFSGVAAAAVVIAVGWMLGWPAVQAPPAAPQVTSATVDALSGRVAAVEARAARPAADPAQVARIDALEKAASALRGDIANLRAQFDKTASALNDAKSAAPSAAPDLAALTDRIAQLERASKTERAELAQQGEKIAEAKTMDDKPLRYVVAASLLDVAVRHGDPYQSQLAAARSLATKPDMLKPLEAFASSGIPTSAALSRELLNIVPKLSPPAEAPSSEAGIVERLQAGASKLVRIERTDGVGNDRGAIVTRVTAAALRSDFAEARRELKTLPEADRAPAQAWLDKADARDAALAASRKFADDAMADLAKSTQ